MELNIKEKFNDFIKLIENQKKESSNNFIAEVVANNCICSLTSDSGNSNYIAENSHTSNKNNKSVSKHNQSTSEHDKSSKTAINIVQDKNCNNSNNSKSIKTNYSNNINTIEKTEVKKYKDLFDLAIERGIPNDDMSLLDDNTIIIKEVNNKINLEEASISSESKEIIENNKKIRNKFNNDEEELEHLFNKIIRKRNKKNIITVMETENAQNNNQNIYDNQYIHNKQDKKDIHDIEGIIRDNSNDISLIFKKIYKIIHNDIFIESTRGWNTQNNIYIMNFVLLKKNLANINIGLNNNSLSIGYLYRDFDNPKSFVDKDIGNYWLDVNLTKNIVVSNSVKPKSKLLTSCIKNLEKSSKFKKRIGHHCYKCFKKKVQVYGNKNIIIEIIFYIKYLVIS